MLFAGIDFGTTNTKAVLCGPDGQIVSTVSLAHDSRPDVHRISPRRWYEHFTAILATFSKHFSGEQVYVSFTTQGGSFAVLDKEYKEIDDAWLWTGQARAEIVEKLAFDFGRKAFYRMTGWQPLGFLMCCKLRKYFDEHGRSGNCQHIVTVPDYITSQLVQMPITDPTNVQMTGLYDIGSGQWRKDVLDWARCDMEAMSRIAKDISVLFENVKTPSGRINIVSSSHDQYAAMESAGVQNGHAMLGTGTAWVLNGRSEKLLYDEESFSIHPGRDLRSGFGFIATLGPVGQCFEQLLAKAGIGYAQLTEIEKTFDLLSVPDKAIDLLTIDVSDSAKAIQQYMQTVAAMICYNLEKLGLAATIDKLIMRGGATASSVWPQILADICNIPIETTEFPEFTAYGAALIAKQAVTGERFASKTMPGLKTMYYPKHNTHYRSWYVQIQKPFFEQFGWNLIK